MPFAPVSVLSRSRPLIRVRFRKDALFDLLPQRSHQRKLGMRAPKASGRLKEIIGINEIGIALKGFV